MAEVKTDLKMTENAFSSQEAALFAEQGRSNNIQRELDYLRMTNTNLLDRLEGLSVVSKAGAENIKQSLEALNEQNEYIRNLTMSMQLKTPLI